MEVTGGGTRGVLIDQKYYEGYCIDLIKKIAKHLNFKYQFELVPDGQYGAYDPQKKSWSGLIGRLLDRVCETFYIAKRTITPSCTDVRNLIRAFVSFIIFSYVFSL